MIPFDKNSNQHRFTGLKFNISAIASNFKMSINSDDLFFIKINLIAVFVLIVLIDILMEQKGHPSQVESEEKGQTT
jgi:hypothetical protein